LELLLVSVNQGQLGREVHCQGHAPFAAFAGDELETCTNNGGEVDATQPHRDWPGELAQPLHQALTPLGFSLDNAQAGVERMIGGDVLQEILGEAENDPKGIIEFVG